ncbi:BgTH12-03992 [Blumeria graminis f. sp. triticale]|uniref:BgTH12-03992 n=1 Tax=Blumeria graminis f. sp. triticale TaxID=1689686 RepID=A0A9W4DHV6_BLUGR|nr:BgTH12-03992 [Blumeria graminis f. sp. triticale]
MVTSSRTVHEQLETLEKLSAPFEEQILEAATLIGLDIEENGRLAEDRTKVKRLINIVPYKREEWSLIWLLKNLKAEPLARTNPSSWWLLKYLIEALPQRSAARILTSKELFVTDQTQTNRTKISILCVALQQALEATETISLDNKNSGTSDYKIEKTSSKKRKRTREQKVSNLEPKLLPELMEAIFSSLSAVFKAGSKITNLSKTNSTAYMRKTYTASDEEAAFTLALWVGLCEKVNYTNVLDKYKLKDWLSLFIEVFPSRIRYCNESSLITNCIQSVLSLIHSLRKEGQDHSCLTELELWVARNVIIPSKSAFAKEKTPSVFESMIGAPICSNISYAAIIFDISIRSVRFHANRRRSAEDENWLFTVFKSLYMSMPKTLDSKIRETMHSILQLCLDYHISPDSELIRTITNEVLLSEREEDWELISTIITLDANLFLIPVENNNLLDTLWDRISKTSFQTSCVQESKNIASRILVPLMYEFSKARSLSHFIKHWFFQLSTFEKKRRQNTTASFPLESAWEDRVLQLELRKYLEPSLTIPQILHIIDWLSEEVYNHPDAVCILLEAICGSVSGQESIVDSISLRPYHIIFDKKRFLGLDSRHKWRAWRILTYTLNWASLTIINELAKRWKTEENPFSQQIYLDSLLIFNHEKLSVLSDSLEIFRSACAAFSVSPNGSAMEYFMKPIVLDHLRCLINDACMLPLVSRPLLPLVRCVFVEYPKCLSLAIGYKDSFRAMLISMFNFASEVLFSPIDRLSECVELEAASYSDLWVTALQSDEIISSKELTDLLIEVMLPTDDNSGNQNEQILQRTALSILTLSQIPFEILKKVDRERIMELSHFPEKSEKRIIVQWSGQIMALDSALLSLKYRIMERYPALYKGLKFKTLTKIADSIMETDYRQLETNVSLLRGLVHLMFTQAFKNLDHNQNKSYLVDAFTLIRKRIGKAYEKKRYHLSYAFISVAEAALVELRKKSSILDQQDILSKEGFETTTQNLREYTLIRLKSSLNNFQKTCAQTNQSSNGEDAGIIIIINSLIALGVTADQLADIESESQELLNSESDIGRRLNTLLCIYSKRYEHEEFGLKWQRTVALRSRREEIKQVTEAAVSFEDNDSKLKFLSNILRASREDCNGSDKLLAVRHLIISIEDTKIKKIDNVSTNLANSSDHIESDLTTVYVHLCTMLRKSQDLLSFCIISESLDIMLRTKTRAISQFCIDSTLGSISLLCSPQSPLLPASRAGTIYLHLTQLLRSVLVHHRLKLKGHFPLLQLTMQALLRCLFQPSLHHRTYIFQSSAADFSNTPVWLTNPQHQLSSRHAESYTRLLSLISDPSASSVQVKNRNILTPALDTWKRTSLLFMRFVLMDFIRWQLELRMLSNIKEKLIPGFYAVLDTTTPETRKLISAELNSSGRAIFAGIYKDYQKFGKWKGS